MPESNWAYGIGIFLLFLAILLIIIGIIMLWHRSGTILNCGTTNNNLLNNNNTLNTCNVGAVPTNWGWGLIILGVIFLIIAIVMMFAYAGTTPVAPVVPATPPVPKPHGGTDMVIHHESHKHGADLNISTTHGNYRQQQSHMQAPVYYSERPITSAPSVPQPPAEHHTVVQNRTVYVDVLERDNYVYRYGTIPGTTTKTTIPAVAATSSTIATSKTPPFVRAVPRPVV